MCPADIPVIVREYTIDVYPKVLDILNAIGKAAVEDLHPWILCTLIDWERFDRVICDMPGTTCEDKSGSDTSSEPLHYANDHQKIHDTKMQIVNERADGGSSSSGDVISDIEPLVVQSAPSKIVWTKSNVLLLITEHQRREEDFRKTSVKKKMLWLKIASGVNKASNGHFSGAQCEQKWKNITKVFRDTMDYNSKSGNERKECHFFQELQETYGYRPNVSPVYVGSSVASFKESSVETEDDSSSHTDGLHTPSFSSKRMKKNRKDAVIEMLNEMREDMKEENKQLMDVLAKQHEDRMANEKNKLDLFEKIVNAFPKSNDVTK